MPVHNTDIAAIFDRIADLLELQDANPFRVRAYRNAARYLQGSAREAATLVAENFDLDELPGIGPDLAARIREIVTTGRCALLDQLERTTPASVAELLKLPGLGPVRVRKLHEVLGIETIEQLARAAHDGRVRELPGFGARTEQRILDAIARQGGSARRMKLAHAARYAEPLRAHLAAVAGVLEVVIAGSYRRARDTVGDLDFVIASGSPAAVMAALTAYDEVAEVVAQGPTRATVRLKSGLQVDARVVPHASFGAALVYFTGSKAHNIAIRRRAQERDLKINEYGVFRGTGGRRTERIAGATEASVYAALGLPWIPPELREDRGEVEAAAAGRLPELVERADLKGDLHAHTTATDGRATLDEMAEAARHRGLEYLAITEHSRRLTVAHGLDAVRLRRQQHEIEALNARLRGFTVLKGIEVDILEDGSLDLPDAVLRDCDVVVAAVHGAFTLSRAKQTERIMKAMDHPCVHVIAHPTGRLVAEREPYDVDIPRLLRHARDSGCILEINAHPDRLDLADVYCRQAREEGVRMVVSSDAHGVEDFDHLEYGIGQARRGWLTAGDVINTRPIAELRRLLKR